MLAGDASVEQATDEDREQAVQITETLGGLPLALDQTGAYLEETGCSLSAYQQFYQQHRSRLLSERRGLVDDHPAPVATTWSLSFQKVKEKNPDSADLLRLCAYLASDTIPEEILTAGALVLGPVLDLVAANAFLLNQAIEVIRAYSLVQRDPRRKALSMHRLVQAVLQDEMEETEQRIWAERAILAVNAVFPKVEHSTWTQCERLLPHALLSAQWSNTYQISRMEVGRLLYETAYYLSERARYQEAEPLYLRALCVREQQLGETHSQVAYPLLGLANLYREQDKYAEAEPLYLRALHILEQQLGKTHPRVAYPLIALANLYSDQDRYAEAELLYLRALRIREQQLGKTHPHTAYPLNNLACLYFDQGKCDVAESLYQQAWHLWEQQLGPEHLQVAYPLLGLANLYREQGKYADAEPLYLRALSIRRQQLGETHPNVVYPLSNLAKLYSDQCKYTEAESLYQQVLGIYNQRLGSDPNDAVTYRRRGYVYLYLKKRDDACADFARYADLRSRNMNAAWMAVYAALGRQHPGEDFAVHLETIAALDPQRYEAYVCRGVALGLRGKPQEGLTELEQILYLKSNNEDALFWKGMMHAYLGHHTMARETIEQALHASLPPILLTPLFWLEQERPLFYQEYAEPLLDRYGLT